MTTTLQQDISAFLVDFNTRKQEKTNEKEYIISKYNEAIERIFTYFNSEDRPRVLCEPKKVLEVKTYFSPLKFVNNRESRLAIELNDDFEPVYTFQTQLINDSPIVLANIKMNHLFKIESVKIHYHNGAAIIGNKHPLFPFLKLLTDFDNMDLQNLFSDYAKPGVYDFTSDEFSAKLAILNMMYV